MLPVSLPRGERLRRADQRHQLAPVLVGVRRQRRLRQSLRQLVAGLPAMRRRAQRQPEGDDGGREAKIRATSSSSVARASSRIGHDARLAFAARPVRL